ncbi:Nuclear transcription factor Y subunit alpha [Galdieria sulphuraria]|uniref:Nuclear transcription factor Y subunit n=1 Tax=Galdieria sulphuraria TaxID=130081 RepID=M2Y7U6_GALSU|nr:nuclear transcription factor Y, alpha [Galdieria sulphuraria]EME31894.1 nuclear transcription factor Y, alpha [Galdieria sulphuraria]GJD10401.1 Nuclear transcription factor Y subunit alpha [Galdieria sulphuraria]|eukprot:XP_005708414.1 nuclear transcription factor Y, alpha [Galdieria sulphuraria]
MQAKSHLPSVDSGRPFHNLQMFLTSYEPSSIYSQFPGAPQSTHEVPNQLILPPFPELRHLDVMRQLEKSPEKTIPFENYQEPPVYVNAKQYHRILKRREARKRQLGKEAFIERKVKRPYRHESRHRHAKNRQRGTGGRFLSKSEMETASLQQSDEGSSQCFERQAERLSVSCE